MSGFAACLLLSAAGYVGAQEPAAPPASSPPPTAWTGTGQISFLRTSGNTETSVLGLAFTIKYKTPSPWSGEAAAALNRGSVAGQENLRNLTAELRARRGLDPRTDIFVETAYAEDTYAGINSRLGVEVGLSHAFRATGSHLVSGEAGLGLAHEVRLPGYVGEDFGFGSVGLTYKHVLSKTADFQNRTGYIANLKDWGDWRLQNTASLSALLNARFSLKLTYTVSHFNTPPIGKKRTDVSMAAALVTRF